MVDRSVQPAAHLTPAGESHAAGEAPLLLAPRTRPRSQRKLDSSGSDSRGALTTVFGSLVIVLIAFFVLAWISRNAAPQGMAPRPSEVFESLGRAPLSNRQQLQLIRVGNKLVLLGVNASGTDTLTEITEPEEVDRLAGLCRQNQPGSITATFRQVLDQYGGEAGGADEWPDGEERHA